MQSSFLLDVVVRLCPVIVHSICIPNSCIFLIAKTGLLRWSHVICSGQAFPPPRKKKSGEDWIVRRSSSRSEVCTSRSAPGATSARVRRVVANCGDAVKICTTRSQRATSHVTDKGALTVQALVRMSAGRSSSAAGTSPRCWVTVLASSIASPIAIVSRTRLCSVVVEESLHQSAGCPCVSRTCLPQPPRLMPSMVLLCF